ncbi:MAG: serine acetyltransferase [Phycisphaerales bacterium]|nr:serine acetyltransferase [Phycisphaerales bacterium]
MAHAPELPAQTVERIVDSIRLTVNTRHLAPTHLPNTDTIIRLLEEIRALIFPGFFGSRTLSAESLAGHVRDAAERVAADLCRQIEASLAYMQGLDRGGEGGRGGSCQQRARELTLAFLDRLPEIRRLLALDVQAAYDGDPAARHTDEIIFSYPGVKALTVHRVSHELYRLDVPLLPRIMSEHAHAMTGIDIHPGASIGEAFFIDHGTGVVVGETTQIGRHCRLYQGVTLGARSFPTDGGGRIIRGNKRHPTLGDRVIVYAGATILGGDTVIGDDCVIGGGVFLTRSVPAGYVVQASRPELRERPDPASGPFEWGGSGI